MNKLRNALMCGLLLMCTSVSADDNASLETRIKAAFLFKFCNYIQWPEHAFEDSASPLVIAVADAAVLAEELEKVVYDRRVGGRSLIVRHLNPGDALEGIHVLFVGGDSTRWQSAFSFGADLPVLTVTDTSSKSAEGIINFVVVNNRVRFDIFQHRADRAGLKLSSLLLSVARQVQTAPGSAL